jgi:hypothetical protein
MNAFVSARPLQPAEENFGGSRVCERTLSETFLDVRVGRGLAVTTRCAGAWVPA